MSTLAFNPNARTPAELLANCQHAAAQLDRWMEMVEAMPEDGGVMEAVQIAAEHLSSQSTLMVIRLRRLALERAARRTLTVAMCAWCDKEEGIVRPLSSGASHGICARHQRMMDAELEVIKHLRPPTMEVAA